MKKTIAIIAITLIAAAIFAADSPRDYLMDAKAQVSMANGRYTGSYAPEYLASPSASYSKNTGLYIAVYDVEGKLDYTLSGDWYADIYMSSQSLVIHKDDGFNYRETVGFALDSWIQEDYVFAARSRNGQSIVIIDWNAATSSKKIKTSRISSFV